MRSTCSSSTDRRRSSPGTGPAALPALPWFAERLVPGATVILDDVDRDGEREVLSRWEQSSDWRFTPDLLTGTATGRLPAVSSRVET